MGSLLFSLFGPLAFKAVASGIGSAVATNVGMVAARGGCDPQDAWTHVIASILAFIFGHMVAYRAPANRSTWRP